MRFQFLDSFTKNDSEDIFILRRDHVSYSDIESCFTREGDYKKQWVNQASFMQVVHLLSVNHIVFLLWYKANNSKGLLSRFPREGNNGVMLSGRTENVK